MNKSFNNLIESILEAGYKSPASLKETDWDDPTERYWDKSPIDITPEDFTGDCKDSRQIKKDKMIKIRQNNIDKSQKELNNWLDKMALRDDISIVVIGFIGIDGTKILLERKKENLLSRFSLNPKGALQTTIPDPCIPIRVS